VSDVRRTPAQRLLPWAPAALLLVVAAGHFVLVARQDLSRWLGGGFGMFSTTDSASSRHVHAWRVQAAGPRQPIEIPPELDPLMRHARVWPTDTNVRRLAEAIARRPDAAAMVVEVEVWRTTYDVVTMAPASVRLRMATAGGIAHAR
jgi:hypothetical protein